MSWLGLSGTGCHGWDCQGLVVMAEIVRGLGCHGWDYQGAGLSWMGLSGAGLSWMELSGAGLSWIGLSGSGFLDRDIYQPLCYYPQISA